VDQPLVSVVIPAYNAAATLRETLGSVLGQTYRRLEVVIVDDGSADGTAQIAAAAARRDPRIRLVRQRNAGVAAARNRGIAETAGTFIAFVDADDLWAPDKIARQVAALQTAGDDTALCYTWFVTIDAAGAILHPGLRPSDQGAVLRTLCQYNFVGNGSSMLMRRTALACVGGFDGSLRARGAQGCEDYDLLLRVAETYKFALVADFLVGYRISTETMSGDQVNMIRSWRLVAERIARRRPELEPLLVTGRTNYAVFLMTGALARGRVIRAAKLAGAFDLPLRRLARPLALALLLRMRQAAAKPVRRQRGAPRRFGDRLPGFAGIDAA
jgi:glycosyltransferase involved in cell wall biosynthesis